MNNSINHKFHHISRAEYQELLAVSRGDAVADYIIDNVSILDLINGGEISGPIAIKGRYIAVLAQNTLMLRLCSGLMPAAQRRCQGLLMLTCILNPA